MLYLYAIFSNQKQTLFVVSQLHSVLVVDLCVCVCVFVVELVMKNIDMHLQ